MRIRCDLSIPIDVREFLDFELTLALHNVQCIYCVEVGRCYQVTVAINRCVGYLESERWFHVVVSEDRIWDWNVVFVVTSYRGVRITFHELAIYLEYLKVSFICLSSWTDADSVMVGS